MNTEQGLNHTISTPTRREIPGPPGHLILGNLPEIQRDRLGFLLSSARKYGPVMKLRFGSTPIIFVTSPEGVQHVLQINNQNYTKQSISVRPLRDMIDTGLLLSDGEFWLKQRRLM